MSNADTRTVEQFPRVSRQAIEKADLGRLLVSMLVRIAQLEQDVAQLRKEVPSGKPTD